MNSESLHSSKGKKILIVDDRPDNLRLLYNTLSNCGYDIHCAINGKLALTGATADPPDLILLDIRMPGMNGYEVCQHLKASALTRDIPVIFLSALDEVFDKVQAFAVGGVDYITKPFQVEEVVMRVKNQLALQAAKAEIRQLNAALEQRVQQRTAELEAANQELRREILRRQQAEETLRLQAQIVDQVHDSIIAADLDGYILWWNRGAERMFGYTCREAIGQHLSFIYPKAQHEWLQHQIFAPVLAKGLHDIEVTMCCKSDAKFCAHLALSLLRDSTGTVMGIISYCMDITERRKAEAALRQSEERLNGILASINDIVWSVSAKTLQMLYVNPAAESVYGRPVQEFYNNPKLWLEVVYPEDRKRVEESSQSLLATGQKDIEYRILRPDGEIRWLRDRGHVIYNGTGEAIRLDGIAYDITERKQAEEALRKSEEQFRLTFELAPIGMAIKSLDGKFMRVNRALCQTLGYSSEELLSKTWADVTYPEDLAVSLALNRTLCDGKISDYKIENRYLTKDGRIVYGVLQVALVRDAMGQPLHLIGQFMDITDRKLAEKQLLYDALHDALTGLPNRALLMERVDLALRRAKRYNNYLFAVLFIDLDRFKIINDSLGHLAGDRLLIAIGRKLEKLVRPTDTVARLGGDEFVILLDDIKDIHDAIRMVQAISQELCLPFQLEGRDVFTTPSIGIALSSREYYQGAELVRDADIAMYRAKAKGQGDYEIFNKVMHTQALERLHLENDLHKALERQEFQVFYQPIISLKTGKLAGFEALIRWHHRQRGLVSPAQFIPIAEETGAIVAIGEWILWEACFQLRSWQLQFPWQHSLTISINLSAKQLREQTLLDCIDQILAQTGLVGSSVKLELTESILMENVNSILKILKHLRDRKIQLSIDDFGTGYSSLSYLHRFPVNTLKIDRSFVNRIDTKDDNLEIVKTIVTLAHHLGMDIIAEGVETAQQLEQIKALKCEFAQGYFFAKPLDRDSAEALIVANRQ